MSATTTGDRKASKNNSTTFLDEYQKLLVSVGGNCGDEAITDGDDGGGDGDNNSSSSSPIGITTISTNDITSSDTLLIVDVQHDFLPGGTFGVEEGFSILDGVCDLISKFDSAGKFIVLMCFFSLCETHSLPHTNSLSLSLSLSLCLSLSLSLQ